jgi:hypothetical protein
MIIIPLKLYTQVGYQIFLIQLNHIYINCMLLMVNALLLVDYKVCV